MILAIKYMIFVPFLSHLHSLCTHNREKAFVYGAKSNHSEKNAVVFFFMSFHDQSNRKEAGKKRMKPTRRNGKM